MKLFKYLIILSLSFIFSTILMVSCVDDPDEPTPKDPESGDIKRVVLVYGIASNNLSRFFAIDKAEMKEGLKGIDMNAYRLLVYSVGSQTATEANLEEAVLGADGEIDFKVLKTYDREISSVDPRRLSQVISDVKALRPSPNYGLFLWSHGGNWVPVPKSAPSRDILPDPDDGSVDDILIEKEHPDMYNPVWARWFGQDYDNGEADYGDIIDFCDAIPANTFDFIWFDACYMASIEVLYQLRDKCDVFIGYPTEVWDEGCPYDDVLPFIMKENPQYVGAADAFFTFYENHSRSDKRNAVIGVFDTKRLGNLAEASSKVYSIGNIPAEDGLQVYTRSSNMSIPGYDFLQYTSGFTLDDNNDNVVGAADFQKYKDDFVAALDKLIIYKNATEYDFSRKKINRDFYVPLSCHYYNGNSGEVNNYYRLLDWFNSVYLSNSNM